MKMKMKRIYFLVSMLCAFTFTIKAQQNLEDVVYLKNGSIIHGIIVEQIPNQSIKIQSRDGNIFVYKIAEIEKMTKEISQKTTIANYTLQSQSSNNISAPQPQLFPDLPNGYVGTIELGYALASNYGSTEYLKLNYINGYRFNPYFSAGIGTGIRFYTGGGSAFAIPVFADFRANALKALNSQFSPYVAFGIGYTIDLTYGGQLGGLYVNPSFGAICQLDNKTTIHFGLGIESQSFSGGIGIAPLSFNVGMSF